jgi:hypothetical protein
MHPYFETRNHLRQIIVARIEVPVKHIREETFKHQKRQLLHIRTRVQQAKRRGKEKHLGRSL